MFHSVFKKDTEKGFFILLVEMKGLIQIIFKFRAKKFWVRFNRQTSFWQAWSISYESNCAENKERLILFSCTIWVHDFWKKHHEMQVSPRGTCKDQALKLPSCGLVVFIDMNMYILTEGDRSFKTFMKENVQLLWTVVTYLLKNAKQGIEHNIDSTYGDIRHSWNS